MNKYLKHIERIHNTYCLGGDDWNELVAQANENVHLSKKVKEDRNENNYLFNKSLAPHFYSGPLFELDENEVFKLGSPQMIFVILNPRDEGIKSDQNAPKKSFNSLMLGMSDWYNSPKAENHYALYSNCERFITEYFKDGKGDRKYYNLRKRNACIVDLFPFYSKKTILKRKNNLPKEYIDNIIEGFAQINCPIVVGGSVACRILEDIYANNRITVKNSSIINAYKINSKIIYAFGSLTQIVLGQEKIVKACKLMQS